MRITNEYVIFFALIFSSPTDISSFVDLKSSSFIFSKIEFFIASTTYFDSCFDLVSYDMKSGQSEIICENVFDFAVLGKDYIYIQCDTIPNSEFSVYDYKELLTIKNY